jgi:hypothetical protein
MHREVVHRDTVESTGNRIQWLTFSELFVVAGLAAVQIAAVYFVANRSPSARSVLAGGHGERAIKVDLARHGAPHGVTSCSVP